MADKKKRSLRSLSIFIVIIATYVVLMIVAFLYYPKTYSPLTSTLGQLGNPVISPSGFRFYDVGVIIASAPIFLLVFFMMNVLRRLTVSFDLRGKAFFYLTAIFLSLFAIFNILTLLVPVGTNDKLNSLLSLILFSSYELFAVFSALNIRRKPGHLNWVPYQGFATALINIALMVPFSAGLIIANWITIALCWTYILSFIYEISDV